MADEVKVGTVEPADINVGLSVRTTDRKIKVGALTAALAVLCHVQRRQPRVDTPPILTTQETQVIKGLKITRTNGLVNMRAEATTLPTSKQQGWEMLMSPSLILTIQFAKIRICFPVAAAHRGVVFSTNAVSTRPFVNNLQRRLS